MFGGAIVSRRRSRRYLCLAVGLKFCVKFFGVALHELDVFDPGLGRAFSPEVEHGVGQGQTDETVS